MELLAVLPALQVSSGIDDAEGRVFDGPDRSTEPPLRVGEREIKRAVRVFITKHLCPSREEFSCRLIRCPALANQLPKFRADVVTSVVLIQTRPLDAHGESRRARADEPMFVGWLRPDEPTGITFPSQNSSTSSHHHLETGPRKGTKSAGLLSAGCRFVF